LFIVILKDNIFLFEHLNIFPPSAYFAHRHTSDNSKHTFFPYSTGCSRKLDWFL